MSPRVAAGRGTSERYGWFVVFLLFLAYTLSFVDRQILTLMVEPIKADLELTDTEFSLLHGLAFALFYTFLGLPMGRLVDRYDRRKIIAAGVISWSAMTAACGLSRNYWQLFLARMGVGVGEAALSPAAYSMLSDLFPKERLALAISTYSIGIAAGSGLALFFGGFLIQFAQSFGPVSLGGIGALAPWQLVFVTVGVAGIPLGFAIAWLREPLRRDVFKGEATVAEVVRFMGDRKRFFICFLLGLSIATALGHGVLGWAPAYFMRIHHWTPQQVGVNYGAGVLIAGASGMYFGGRFTQWRQTHGIVDAPLRTSAIGIGMCVPLGMAAPLSDNAYVALVLFSLLQFAYNMPWGVAAAAIQMVSPNEMRGQFSALFLFSINIIGLGTGPTLVALLTDNVYGAEGGVGLSLATAAAVLGPIATLLIVAAFAPYRAAIASAAAWTGER